MSVTLRSYSEHPGQQPTISQMYNIAIFKFYVNYKILVREIKFLSF